MQIKKLQLRKNPDSQICFALNRREARAQTCFTELQKAELKGRFCDDLPIRRAASHHKGSNLDGGEVDELVVVVRDA